MVLRRKLDSFTDAENVVDDGQLEQSLAERLSVAVAIPTPIYDTMGKVGEDERWTIFGTFNDYLLNTFPLAHQKLNLTTINKYGLLYTWTGLSHELKPLLLMAHSDVVPADTSLDLWTHPPFSGKIDDGFVWGRGSEDDKSNLIAMLSVIEHLLEAGFVPTRTILLAIGFDEEGGSDESQGAAFIAAHLLKLYGANGIEMIFDEGVASIENRSGTEIALPATSEKGYLDITVTVNTPGGHSSLPPKHTSVGILAQAVCLIEDRLLASENVEATVHPHQGSSTTAAVTMTHGGDKVNSLPENAFAVVNHRIGQQDTVQRVKALYVDLLSPIACQHGLEFVAFSDKLQTCPSPMSSIVLTDAYALDPSPVTDISQPCFSWLSSAIKKTFGSDCHVQPTCLDGNTDTRYYWDLSKSIYRMSPWRAFHDPRGTRMHTVDERMPTKGLLEMYRFYKELIFASAARS